MIPTIIAIAMLFGCFLGNLPYQYFQVLRWVVCGTCVYRAFICSNPKKKKWIWLFILGAIIFNPIIPFQFKRNIWLILDATLAFSLLLSLSILRDLDS